MTQVPVLEAVLHPPLGLLQRELITGTFSGPNDLTRPSGLFEVNAYGLTWDIVSISDTRGFRLGFPVVWEVPLLQASTTHEGLDGHELISEYHDFYAEGIYWMWNNPFPHRVHVEIPSDTELALFWLIV